MNAYKFTLAALALGTGFGWFLGAISVGRDGGRRRNIFTEWITDKDCRSLTFTFITVVCMITTPVGLILDGLLSII